MWRRQRALNRLDEDIRDHLARETEENLARGMSPAEARRHALVMFGSVSLATEDTRAAWGRVWLEQLAQDTRYALRLFRRSPVVAVVVTLSLALAIGANTAIFSLIDAVVLRTLAVHNPDELYFLAHGEGDEPSTSANYPLLERYRTAPVFSGVTAFRTDTLRVSTGDAVEFVAGQFVSGNYHAVVGVPMILGRGFVSEPDRPASGVDAGIVVISEEYWTRRFARAPDVLGHPLTVQGHPAVVVGVTAAAFDGFAPGTPTDITVPLSMQALNNPKFLTALDGFTSLSILARRRSDLSEESVRAASDAVFQQFMSQPELRWARDQSSDGYSRARLLPAGKGGDGLRRQYRIPLYMLMAMAGLVLLIASANIANLLLSRSSARAKEMAIRLCVGSGRGRVVRQLLTESALLALAGGVLGVLVAFWTTDLVVAVFSNWRQPLTLEVTPNLRVLAFAAGVTLTTGMAFGVAPAMRASRLDFTPELKSGAAAGGAAGRLVAGRVLIVAQIALCVLVVAMAALLAQSVRNLKTQHAGFDPTNLLLFDLDAVGASSASQPGPDRRALYAGVHDRLAGLTGVTAVSMSTMTPLSGSGTYRGLALLGLPETPDARGVWWNQVSDDFFRTLGIRVLQGRTFQPEDQSGSREVAIINERTARYVFGEANPIGRTIAWIPTPDRPLTVIGVVEDTKLADLRREAPRMVYTPLAAQASLPGRAQVAIRTTGTPVALAGAVREVVRSVNSQAVVERLRTMSDQVDGALVRERSLAWLSAVFALLASILAVAGLYGMMSYHVARRTRDIGVRLALGARPRSVLAAVLRQTLGLTLAGVAVGLGGAFMTTEVVATFLYGLTARDPLTFVGVSLALVATAVAAGYLPARRAARIDPLRAIRTE